MVPNERNSVHRFGGVCWECDCTLKTADVAEQEGETNGYEKSVMTFEDWLKTKPGIESNDASGFPLPQPYLQNRLWYAFEAGVESGEKDKRLQKTIEWYEGKLRECKSRNRKLAHELNVLKAETLKT